MSTSKPTDTKVVAIPEESLDGAGTWGVSEAVYNEAVASGNVVVNCDPTEEVFVPPECPPCIEDPNAIVPDWRFKEEGDVFLNGRTCEYCVTVNTGEIDATILNDESSREAFLEEQKIRGVDLILEFFENTPLDADSLNIVLDSALPKQFDVPVRPLLPIRVLVCVPVATIESIEFTPETEEEIVEAESATMRPITGTMTPLNVIPKDSVEQQEGATKAMLRPVQRLTPISSPKKEVKTASITPVLPQMKPVEEESDES